MALQPGALRDALIDAGAKPDKADKAAEELAGYNSEFSGLRADMRQGFAAADHEFAKVRGDINLLRWMAGTNLVLTAGILFRLLSH